MATTDTKTEALKDGGWTSRKFWLVVWTQFLIAGLAALAGKWAPLAPLYPTAMGGLIGAAALFITGNVAAKHVIGKQFDVVATSAPSKDDTATDEK